MKFLLFLCKTVLFLAASAVIFTRLTKRADETLFRPLMEHLRTSDRFTMTEHAMLIDKITESISRSDGASRTEYLLQFHADSGIIECRVSEEVYERVFEGMEGILTRRGTHFCGFEVGGISIH